MMKRSFLFSLVLIVGMFFMTLSAFAFVAKASPATASAATSEQVDVAASLEMSAESDLNGEQNADSEPVSDESVVAVDESDTDSATAIVQNDESSSCAEDPVAERTEAPAERGVLATSIVNTKAAPEPQITSIAFVYYTDGSVYKSDFVYPDGSRSVDEIVSEYESGSRFSYYAETLLGRDDYYLVNKTYSSDSGRYTARYYFAKRESVRAKLYMDGELMLNEKWYLDGKSFEETVSEHEADLNSWLSVAAVNGTWDDKICTSNSVTYYCTAMKYQRVEAAYYVNGEEWWIEEICCYPADEEIDYDAEIAEYEASSDTYAGYCFNYTYKYKRHRTPELVCYYYSSQRPSITIKYYMDGSSRKTEYLREERDDMWTAEQFEDYMSGYEASAELFRNYSSQTYLVNKVYDFAGVTVSYYFSHEKPPEDPSLIHVSFLIDDFEYRTEQFLPSDYGMEAESPVEDVLAEYESTSDLYAAYCANNTLIERVVDDRTVRYRFAYPGSRAVRFYVGYSVNGQAVLGWGVSRDEVSIIGSTEDDLKRKLITQLIEQHPWLGNFLWASNTSYGVSSYARTNTSKDPVTGEDVGGDELSLAIDELLVHAFESKEPRSTSGTVYVDDSNTEGLPMEPAVMVSDFALDVESAVAGGLEITIPFITSVGPYKLSLVLETEGVFPIPEVWSDSPSWTEDRLNDLVEEIRQMGYSIEIESYDFDGSVCRLRCSELVGPESSEWVTVKTQFYVDGVERTRTVQWPAVSDIDSFGADAAVDSVRQSFCFGYYAERFDLVSAESVGQNPDGSWIVEARFTTREVDEAFKLVSVIYVDGVEVESRADYIRDRSVSDQLYPNGASADWLARFDWYADYIEEYELIDVVTLWQGKNAVKAVEVYLNSVDSSIAVTKAASMTSVVAAGEEVTYTVTVTNTGGSTISGITLADSLVALEVSPFDLAPGESSGEISYTYTVTQADVDAGSFTNTVTATGKDPKGAEVTDSASAVVTAEHAPQLTVTKEASKAGVLFAGDEITYTVTVTNTGNVTLTGIVFDDTLATLEVSPFDLAPGESSGEISYTYTVTQADVDAGSFTNTVTATGKDPKGAEVTDFASAVVTAEHAPQLKVIKAASRTSGVAAGDTIAYAVIVKNTGNVTIRGIKLHDTKVNLSEEAFDLAPGESKTISYLYVVTQADVESGSFTNVVTAVGKDPSGSDVTASDDAVVTARPETVEKNTPKRDSMPPAGDSVLAPIGLLLISIGALGVALIAKRRADEE